LNKNCIFPEYKLLFIQFQNRAHFVIICFFGFCFKVLFLFWKKRRL